MDEPETEKPRALTRIATFLFRIGLAVGSIVIVFLSLMTFPAGIPWMVGLWLLGAITCMAFRFPVWPLLLVCAVVLLIKRPGFTAEFFVVETLLITVAVVDFLARKKCPRLSLRQQGLIGCLLVIGWCVFSFLRYEATNSRRTVLLDERPVVCLGDSLTDYGYPQELEKLIRVHVEDFGFDGITTDDGIKLIPEILALRPQAVVLELGGHDFNQGESREHTRKNLVHMIEAFHEIDAEVILVEIPHGFITDSYDGLEREISAEFDLQMISDSLIRSFVLFSPVIPPGAWMDRSRHLSSDGLHPNRRGNERFAKVVADSLSRVFGDEILVE